MVAQYTESKPKHLFMKFGWNACKVLRTDTQNYSKYVLYQALVHSNYCMRMPS